MADFLQGTPTTPSRRPPWRGPKPSSPPIGPQHPTLSISASLFDEVREGGKQARSLRGSPYLRLPSRKPPSSCPSASGAPPRLRPPRLVCALRSLGHKSRRGTSARRSRAAPRATNSPQPRRRGREPRKGAHEPGAAAERARGPASRRAWKTLAGAVQTAAKHPSSRRLRWSPQTPSLYPH